LQWGNNFGSARLMNFGKDFSQRVLDLFKQLPDAYLHLMLR
jgi:hypothetical protein